MTLLILHLVCHSTHPGALLTYSATKIHANWVEVDVSQAEVAVLKTELVRSAAEQQKAAGIAAASIAAAGKLKDLEVSASSDGAKSELASS